MISLSTFKNEVNATGKYYGFLVSRIKADATSFDVMREFLQAGGDITISDRFAEG